MRLAMPSLPRTGNGRALRGGGQVAGAIIDFSGMSRHLEPPEKIVPRPHRHALEFLGHLAAAAAHPIEQPLQLVAERLVAAAEELDHGAILVAAEVAVELAGVVGTSCRRPARRRRSTKTGIRRFRRSVGITDRQWRRTASRRPRVGVRQRDVPRAVAADAVTGEEHAVGVDRRNGGRRRGAHRARPDARGPNSRRRLAWAGANRRRS